MFIGCIPVELPKFWLLPLLQGKSISAVTDPRCGVQGMSPGPLNAPWVSSSQLLHTSASSTE